jgi:glycosyltransferase involved in cell wall biosynthesis
MASGTPILSTKLAGIPDEYKDHIFWFEEESVRGISSRLKEVIEKDDQELDAFGKAAQKFLLAEKSAQGIAARLIKFLYS